MDTETRKKALADFLEISENEFYVLSETEFKVGRQEYLVLTDEEADEKARTYILDSVWAFRPEFLAAHSSVAIEFIKAIQDNGKCESNNGVLLSAIKDREHFVEDAIKADGRGHHLSTYDGEENEQNGLFIYRTN